jgi:hypothetical protein
MKYRHGRRSLIVGVGFETLFIQPLVVVVGGGAAAATAVVILQVNTFGLWKLSINF